MFHVFVFKYVFNFIRLILPQCCIFVFFIFGLLGAWDCECAVQRFVDCSVSWLHTLGALVASGYKLLARCIVAKKEVQSSKLHTR